MKKVQTNVVFQHLEQSDKRITIEEGGTRCFTGETLVLTEKGHKPINQITTEDKVWSLNTTTNLMELKQVREVYEYKQTKQDILTFLNDKGCIYSTYGHEFYYKGQWSPNFELAKRVLARSRGNKRKILHKQFRKIEDYQLQKNWSNKDYETSLSQKSSEEQRLLSKDNDKERGKVSNSINSQISSQRIYTQSSEQTRSESHKWDNQRQSSRKLRMGNSFREHNTFISNRITKTQKRSFKRNEQINRATSKRNKNKIQTKGIYGQRFSQRIQCKFIDNQRHFISKKKQNALASREISLNDIKSFKFESKVCDVYDLEVEHNHNYIITKDNIVVSNSGKTYNIIHWLIKEARTKKNQTITITRKSFPSLRNSAMRDFLHIMENDLGIYEDSRHNRSENIYKFESGSIIEFVSMDMSSKKKGAKRDYLYMNEADEFTLEDYRQLILRTRHKVILDYNPANEFHWIYEHVDTRKDCDLYTTTYLDNPFLEDSIVREIEHLKDVDLNYWRIYGLGLRGVSEATIFTNWEYGDALDGSVTYGLDFGYNDPCALVKAVYRDGEIFAKEELYESYLTGDMLRDKMKKLIKDRNAPIYADSSRPELIQELYNAGFNIKPTMKGKGSVKQGIDFLKRHKLIIESDSVNLAKEIRGYKWKTDKDGKILEDPVDLNNHMCDALRYSMNHRMKPKSSVVVGRTSVF